MSPIRFASALLAVTLAACGTGEVEFVEELPQGEEIGQAMTWNEFLNRTFQEPESGVFIVDGDLPLENFKQLREFYETYVQTGQLIIHRNGSVDAKWSNTQKKNLTYCVSSTFGTRHASVVQAMAEATAAWEAAADVDFIHVSAQDSNCTASNNNVLFDVRPVNVNGEYLARAFFPDDSRSYRNILIDNSAFTSYGNPTLTGVLRHELGHTLGFRHEHTRPESGACFEDSQWRALTSYDPYSVMHYPHCNGKGDWALTLTALDKQGAAAVYGEPGGGSGGGTGGGTGTTRTATTSDSVAQGAWKHYAAIKVVPGTAFTVEMSGSGDPDLYVRFGAQPTTSSYNCRPYREGAAETCSLTVPSGITEAFVSVRGYTAASYTLKVTWTEPATSGGGTGGTAKTASYSGSVAKSANKYHGPLTVKAGTTFKVVMSGSGDPDLYVKFGGQPTTSSYDCRPYLSGANETCSLTVPTGATSAYIMVRGYEASTYSLAVNYTAP